MISRPLNHQTMLSVTRQIAENAQLLAEHYPQAHQLLTDWQGTGSTGTGVRGSGHSDPTATTATTAVDTGKPVDPAYTMLLERDRCLIETRDLLGRLVAQAQNITNPKPVPTPECELCARIGHHTTIYARTAPEGQQRAIARCEWHHDWWTRYTEDATLTIAEYHRDHPGAKIPLHLIRQEHPDAYLRHHAGVLGAKH